MQALSSITLKPGHDTTSTVCGVRQVLTFPLSGETKSVLELPFKLSRVISLMISLSYVFFYCI